MAHFYRDQIVINTTISKDDLIQLNTAFESQRAELNEGIENTDPDKWALYYYVIRFDNKGYRVFTFEELLNYFKQAKYVERIIFTVETLESVRTNRNTGSYIELRLDEKEPNNSNLVTTSDNSNWVDSSFCAVKEVLEKCKNNNGYIRNSWALLFVQIIGVIIGFGFSLWAALYISPKLNIDNPFIISFIFVLLIFSNIWTYLNQVIVRSIDKLFPNMKFYRVAKNRLHWLMQAIVGGVAVAVTLYFMSTLLSYIGEILAAFINKSA